jgi:hypothetical protein
VIHSISLPPGEFGNGNVQRLFTNQLDWEAHAYFQGIRGLQVSSHFFIARSGALWQFVGCGDRAWHAGESHYRGRGNCNDDSIGIELEGLEGGTFEAPQYETLPGCAPRCFRPIPSPISRGTSTSRRAANRIPVRASTGLCCKARWLCRLGIFPKPFDAAPRKTTPQWCALQVKISRYFYRANMGLC